MARAEDSVKIHIDLPNHWAGDGESLWARPLGNDLYEIDNIPFYAYGLNVGDVVLAVPASGSMTPSVIRMVRRSDHRTLRTIFATTTSELDRLRFMKSILPLGVEYERATDTLFAVDVPPGADYQALCNVLSDAESDGILSYETCEERVPGSFDDDPDGYESE